MRKLLFAVTAMLVFWASNQAMAFDVPGTSVSTKIELTAEQALAKMKADNPNLTGDFYLVESPDTTIWRIFINPAPNKNWGHECFVCDMPRVIESSQHIIFNPDTLDFPPAEKMRAMESSTIQTEYKPVLPPITPHEPADSAANHTYAVILSGGKDLNANGIRYWHDCAFIYTVLRNKYAIPKENIYPVMADGDDPSLDTNVLDQYYISQNTDLDADGEKDIFYGATRQNFFNVMNQVSQKIKHGEHFFLFVIDHGGLEAITKRPYIQLWGSDKLYEEELAASIYNITSKGAIASAVLGQCYSGAFVDDLEQNGCVVASASQPHEPSYSTSSRLFDDFVYRWTMAMNEADVDGEGSLREYVDKDNDGKVTMYEAFLYAKNTMAPLSHPMYSSTPTILGNKLSFKEIPAGIDPYVKYYAGDDGSEPNFGDVNCLDSPSIWVRHNEDGANVHQNPIIGQRNYVYVRVHNRGAVDYIGGQKITVYWSLNSILYERSAWISNNDSRIETYCGHTESMEIPPIAAESYIDVAMPLSFPNVLVASVKGEQGVGLLAEIQPSDETNSNIRTSVFNCIHESNNLACAKKIIVNNFRDIYVANLFSEVADQATYSVELIPETNKVGDIVSNGYIELTLGKATARKWLSSGGKLSDGEILGEDEDGNLKMKLTSAASLEGIKIESKETVQIGVKVNLTKLSQNTQRFFMQIKTENGEIVGGQIFEISPKTMGKIPVAANQNGNGEIELSIEDKYDSVQWTNAAGENIGTENSITVSPSLNNCKFQAIAVDGDGNLAEGEVSLDGMFGIRHVTEVAGQLTVKLNSPAPSHAVIVVSSSIDGTANCTAPVPAQSDEVTLDCTNLHSGIYTVSYMVDNTLVNSKNITVN